MGTASRMARYSSSSPRRRGTYRSSAPKGCPSWSRSWTSGGCAAGFFRMNHFNFFPPFPLFGYGRPLSSAAPLHRTGEESIRSPACHCNSKIPDVIHGAVVSPHPAAAGRGPRISFSLGGVDPPCGQFSAPLQIDGGPAAPSEMGPRNTPTPFIRFAPPHRRRTLLTAGRPQ